jgi:hypothetical protein
MQDETTDPFGVQPTTNAGQGGLQITHNGKPMSLQNALIMAMMSALIGSLGTGGGLTLFGARDLEDDLGDMQQELAGLRLEIRAINGKIDDVVDVIDRKHPRQ